jgi:hypothetical protein
MARSDTGSISREAPGHYPGRRASTADPRRRPADYGAARDILLALLEGCSGEDRPLEVLPSTERNPEVHVGLKEIYETDIADLVVAVAAVAPTPALACARALDEFVLVLYRSGLPAKVLRAAVIGRAVRLLMWKFRVGSAQ